MITITWGPIVLPISVQWGLLVGPTPATAATPTSSNPVAVMIATSGTAAPTNWAQVQW